MQLDYKRRCTRMFAETVLFERERPELGALTMPSVLRAISPVSVEVYRMLHYHYFVNWSRWKLGTELYQAFLNSAPQMWPQTKGAKASTEEGQSVELVRLDTVCE